MRCGTTPTGSRGHPKVTIGYARTSPIQRNWPLLIAAEQKTNPPLMEALGSLLCYRQAAVALRRGTRAVRLDGACKCSTSSRHGGFLPEVSPHSSKRAKQGPRPFCSAGLWRFRLGLEGSFLPAFHRRGQAQIDESDARRFKLRSELAHPRCGHVAGAFELPAESLDGAFE